MTSIFLGPIGIFSLSVPQKYRINDILDLDDSTVSTFAKILYIPKPSRYSIIYTLAINNFLIVPPSDDLVDSFQRLSLIVEENPLEWVRKNRTLLLAMDELIISEGTNLRVPLYELTLTGKRSGMFYLFENILGKTVQNRDISTFEQSFHILPDKFIGGKDRINDQDIFRAKIRTSIELNFILNDATIEQTFRLIDDIYFSNLLKYRLQAAGKKISFRISHQMTRTAGSMTSKHFSGEYIITISSKLNEVLGNKLSGGIRVNGPIDAFIVTLQHEITHLIVHLEMDRLGMSHTDVNESNEFKSHGTIFQNIGERFFGLTERTHRLFENEDESSAQPLSYDSSQLSVGDRVYFVLKGNKAYGKITKLNPKRVKVLLDSGALYSVVYSGLHRC